MYPTRQEVILLQIRASGSYVIGFTLLLVVSISLRLIASHVMIETFLLASVYVLILLLTMAASTAIHESAHFTALEELDMAISRIRAHRIGNVSFHIDESDEMTQGEIYQVASVPYRTHMQYGLEGSTLGILVILNLLMPLPLNLMFAVMTVLVALQFLGGLCGCLVVKEEKTEGICVALAKITSKEDIEDIVAWNRRNTNGSEAKRE
ncbi:hypothetical protein EU546_02850 [Candidatus Thorarchaeota archaeon]|nr:MAG: hypothetical protein EU546_02850 [Candidatus Thorarchaeota archaeon]